VPEYVLNRNHTLRTTAGHIITFVKGQPTWVPPMIEKEAVAIGAERVDGDKVDVLGEEAPPAPTYSPDEREQMIMLAFETLIEKNERKSFTAQGVPTDKAVEAITGFEVSTKERQELWQKYKEAKAGEGN
jgi:hypothetical protein